MTEYKYTTEVLTQLANEIQSFSVEQQMDVLRRLSHDHCVLNESSQGTFVNLTELSDSILTGLFEYVEFIRCQDTQIQTLEEEQEKMRKLLSEDKTQFSFSTTLRDKT